MKNKKVTILLILIAISSIIGFIYWFGSVFAPGSYPYAEHYILNYSEEDVKNAINKFKEENPEYKVPEVTIKNDGSFSLPDEKSKEPAGLFCVYFYDKKENQILFTWVAGGEDKTKFAFVSINKGLDLGHWKDINKDFDDDENEKQKKLFEERILNKVKEELKNR